MFFSLWLVLAAAPKPPACDATTNGVIWNFGTAAAPNFRQCDGISYIPVQLCPGPVKPAEAAPVAPTRNDCARVCVETQKACLNDCAPGRSSKVTSDIQERACKESCGEEFSTCNAACWKQFPAKQPTRSP